MPMRLAVLSAIAVASMFALAGPRLAHAADDAPSGCQPFDHVKERAAQHGVRFITLNNDQWEFTRGVSALAPMTPKGLPPGDHAVLGTVDDEDGAFILFIDGENACFPFPVPKELLEMIIDVGKGTIHHEGNPL